MNYWEPYENIRGKEKEVGGWVGGGDAQFGANLHAHNI